MEKLRPCWAGLRQTGVLTAASARISAPAGMPAKRPEWAVIGRPFAGEGFAGRVRVIVRDDGKIANVKVDLA